MKPMTTLTYLSVRRGMSPDVLVNTNARDPAETVWLIDRDSFAPGQDGVAHGVPSDAKAIGKASVGGTLPDDPFKRAAQSTAG